MTQETQDLQNSALDAFLKQRAKRQNSVAIEARKLVNLYRQLSLFGNDFLDTYNNMLLAATPEVQRALPDIIGGTVVRQYLEFLKGRAKQNDTDDIISEEEAIDAFQYRHTESYLPSPDDVPPFVMNTSVSQSGDSHLDGALTAQMSAFERMLEQQNAFLSQALTQLQQNMSSTNHHVSSDGQPVDMTASLQAQKEMLSELLTHQNEKMNENIRSVLAKTQELSSRQMETVEKLIQKQTPQDPYAIIAEEVTSAPQTNKTTSSSPYTSSHYRSEEPSVLHQTEIELEPVEEHKEQISINEGVNRPKRYSSISLNDYYTEQDEITEDTTSSSWKE